MHTPSIAGTPQAAKLGGALQSRTRDLASAQAISHQPAGKVTDTDAVDAGDQAGDRAPDGRQPRDTFERSNHMQTDSPAENQPSPSGTESTGIDYQA